jgi:hypothetical protein
MARLPTAHADHGYRCFLPDLAVFTCPSLHGTRPRERFGLAGGLGNVFLCHSFDAPILREFFSASEGRPSPRRGDHLSGMAFQCCHQELFNFQVH